MKLSGGHLVTLGLIALAAAGCGTGSDVLETGNSTVQFDFAVTGDTTGDWDCINFELEEIRTRPLDGICDGNSAEPGKPCLNVTDCVPGDCLSTSADEVVPNDGIFINDAELSLRVNLIGDGCSSVHAPLNGLVFVAPNAELAALPSIVLTEGLYEISRFDVAGMIFFKDNPDVFQALMRYCGETIALTTLDPDTLRFTVRPGEDKLVRVILDLAAWELATAPGDPLNDPLTCTEIRNAADQIFSCEGCDAAVGP